MEITSKGYLSLSNEMIAIAMEGKRLGLHSKSLFAVPNHLTEQTGNAFRELYPNCNILVATENDFTPANRRDILAKIATGDYDAVILGHTQFDMIHLSEEIEREYIEDEIAEVRAALDIARADGADFSVKKIEAELKSLEARLYTLNQKTGKEDLIEFEKLGIDKIFVDESQNYKNLTTPTKLQGVAGLGSKGAGKSTQLLLKCRWLNEQTNYKGVIFSSGTPVSNSMTELYTLFRYLRPDLLKDANIHSFDKWLSVYAEIRTALELSVQGNGSFQLRTRVSKLSNLPEFMKMFKQFADIKTADTLNLKRPICEVQNVVVKPSVYQKRYVKKLGERADKIHAGNVDPRRDNMLKLTTDARKIGLDARCVNPDLPDSPNSKVNVCINNVFDIWQNTADIKGTQLIFCDLATPHKPENENTYSVFRKIDDAYVEIFTDKLPKNADVGIMFDKLCNKPPKAFKEAELTLQEGDIILTTNVDPKEEMAYRNAGVIEGKKIVTLENSQMEAALELEAVSSTNVEKTFCIYDDIKRKLIDMGIPEGEIAYIHDYEKPEDKQRLYDMINRGEIRVMIGSTQKCGAGMNAQKRMVALHDLDVPMRPSDMGQRRGRIERQGNEIPEVTIYRYCTEGTFDAYLYQMLENKQRAISQIMTSKSPNRSCDDIDELTLEWAETKAICSGSPLIKERVQLIIDIQTLNDIKASFLSDKYYLQEKLLKLPQELHYSEYRRERIQSDVDKVKEAANEDFSIEVNGKTYTNKEEGAEALKSYVLSHLPVLQTTMGGELHIGNYKGFNLSISSFKIEGDEYLFGYQFCLQRAYTHTCDANLTAGVKATGNITRLDNCLAAIEEKNLPQIDALIATQKSDLENLEKHINQPFDRQDELDAKEKRLAEVEEALVGLAAENNTPKELFEMVTDMFTGLEKDKEESIYLKSKSEVILPLLISPLGDNCYAMSHNYKQLGDFMDDPRIDFRLDFEKGTLDILSFTQSNMGMYEEYEGKPDAKADCEQFMLQWLDNITEQGFAPCSKEEWRQSVLEHSDDYEPREEKSTDEEVL